MVYNLAENKLFYKQPAACFEQAFVLGNGRLGATVYGGPVRETIHLNEDTFWSGGPERKDVPGAYRYLQQAKKLVAQEKYTQAQELIEQEFQSDMTAYYLPLADLYLDFPAKEEAESYSRVLDIEQAVAYIGYKTGHVEHTRTVFASHPSQAIVYRLNASARGQVNFTLSASSHMRYEVLAKGMQLAITVQAPGYVVHDFEDSSDDDCYRYDTLGMAAQALVEVRVDGGFVKAAAGKLTVVGANAADIYICANTAFAGWNQNPLTQGKDFEELNRQQMAMALSKPATTLLQQHVEDYRRLFGEFALSFGATGREDRPTDERLALFEKDQNDPGLYVLLCQFGRYLAIASSRAGTQPANLQGIWNHRKRPPWRCGLTTNINLQMNDWPLAATGLAECAMPLVQLMEECAEAGHQTAREYYGAGGFVVHHNTDLWRATWPVGRGRQDSAAFGFWNMGGVWLCRNLWDLYEHTQDKALLKERLYPLFMENAEFVLDCLTQTPDGYLWITPATSPENRFLTTDGMRCGVAGTSTMTMALVRDLFDICLQAGQILGVEKQPIQLKISAALPRLYPLQVGSKGSIMEWDVEFAEDDAHHRHISHLYGLYPAQQITVDTPELAKAAQRSLTLRGDEGTGWSLCWKICAWARLRDGEHALALVNRQLTPVDAREVSFTNGGTYPNLLDAHPPFQIDGNFGVLAGVCEMLVQSKIKEVYFLPALPRAWHTGSLQGLVVRGGLTIGLRWQAGRVVEITAQASQEYCGTFFVNGQEMVAILTAGSYKKWKL